MRATIHNARAGKNGVFSPRHNDRNFDTSHADHIDPERGSLNRYWNWMNRPEISFEDAERLFYEKYIQSHLDAQNAKYEAQRHTERVRSMDEYRASPRTCPEEVIWQIGKAGNTIPADMAARIIQEQINWEQQMFPGLRVLDVALHQDEQGAPHIHERRAWLYTDSQGHHAIGQGKALAEMGVNIPHPDKPQGRYNNRKIEFSRLCREHFLQVCRAHGLEIEETPQEPSRSGLTQTAYKTRQEQEKAARAEHVRHVAERSLYWTQEEQRAAQQDVRACDEYVREMQQQIADQQGELADLAMQRHDLQNEINDLQEHLDDLQEQVDLTRRDYQREYHACERLRRRAATLQKILTDAEQRQVAEIQQEHEQEKQHEHEQPQIQFEEDEPEIG